MFNNIYRWLMPHIPLCLCCRHGKPTRWGPTLPLVICIGEAVVGEAVVFQCCISPTLSSKRVFPHVSLPFFCSHHSLKSPYAALPLSHGLGTHGPSFPSIHLADLWWLSCLLPGAACCIFCTFGGWATVCGISPRRHSIPHQAGCSYCHESA